MRNDEMKQEAMKKKVFKLIDDVYKMFDRENTPEDEDRRYLVEEWAARIEMEIDEWGKVPTTTRAVAILVAIATDKIYTGIDKNRNK